MESKKIKDRNILNHYAFGFGVVGVQSGHFKGDNESIPFIDLIFLEKQHEIGEEPKQEPKEVTRMTFNNIESLEILQKALDYCRTKLSENEQH